MTLSKKFILLIGALLITAVAAFALTQDKKPTAFSLYVDDYNRWPVEIRAYINGNGPWNGGNILSELRFEEGSSMVDFNISWAEVHTGKSYQVEIKLPYEKFYRTPLGDLGIYLKTGVNGELFLGTQKETYAGPIQEIITVCGLRTPDEDSSFKESIKLRMINSGDAINSWLDEPLPATSCPEPQE